MMKALFSLMVGLCLLLSVWMGLGVVQPAIAQTLNKPETYIVAQGRRNPVDKKLGEVGLKIDLNNSNVLTFRRYSGLYPTLARKVIENAPFDTVEDVLDIPGLTDRERDVLKENLDNFVVTPPEPSLIEGGDRINPGIYD
jgi:photosystem II PsbU protein